MKGEKNLTALLKNLKPQLHKGEYVFVTLENPNSINRDETIGEFKEAEGTTVIITKQKADSLQLEYNYIAAWITLQVHSALEAVGLTAAFSTALAENNISCNVVAGYYHDHIFVDVKDAEKAIEILGELGK